MCPECLISLPLLAGLVTSLSAIATLLVKLLRLAKQAELHQSSITPKENSL